MHLAWYDLPPREGGGGEAHLNYLQHGGPLLQADARVGEDLLPAGRQPETAMQHVARQLLCISRDAGCSPPGRVGLFVRF